MICGIDPGKTGAIAFLYSESGFLDIYDMPVIGKEISGTSLASMFREFTPDHIYIESVNSFSMGRQSAFMFGQGYGVLKGVMATLNLPYTALSPAKWKKHFGLSRDKDQSRLTATRLFPTRSWKFQRKKDDGRAEAALIALYGQQQGIIR